MRNTLISGGVEFQVQLMDDMVGYVYMQNLLFLPTTASVNCNCAASSARCHDKTVKLTTHVLRRELEAMIMYVCLSVCRQ